MDLVPGLVTYQWFTPTKVGTYEMLCEELCGVGHFAMRGRMVVDEPGRLRQVARDAADVRATRRRGRSATRRPGPRTTRSARHATASSGEGNQQLNAPKLAGLNDWYMRRQLLNLPARRPRHRRRATRSAPQMAPMSQTVAGPGHARERARAHQDAAGYPGADRRSRAMSSTAARLFETCQLCHGDKGEGTLGHERAEARGHERLVPRSASSSTSRLACRGGHASDIYGDQMNMIAECRSCGPTPSTTSWRTSIRSADVRSIGETVYKSINRAGAIGAAEGSRGEGRTWHT